MLWLLGIFFQFWFIVPGKIWQPWLAQTVDPREKEIEVASAVQVE
jgi:hypothetical protein